jgi:membrane protein
MDNFIDTLSQIDQIYLWDLIGTAVFGVSGVLVGLERRMDVFGMLILAFVTGVGGGTLRDIMIGSIPVFWMNNLTYILMIVISVVLTIIFRKQFSEHWSKSLMLFDTIGLGVFTIIGIEKALRFGLSPTIAIILGTMTGSFGGVIRDILANKLPALFHKEIYATACIAGGTVYFLINGLMNHNLVVFITIMVVISVRLLSLKYHWELPKF